MVYIGHHNLPDLEGCDVACVFNIALYPPETREALEGKRTIRYFNDVAPHGDHELTRWLLGNATCVFTSPAACGTVPLVERQQAGLHLIPPPVNLKPFREAASGHRGALGPFR